MDWRVNKYACCADEFYKVVVLDCYVVEYLVSAVEKGLNFNEIIESYVVGKL